MTLRDCTHCGRLLTQADRRLCRFCRQRALRLVDEGKAKFCETDCGERECCLERVLGRAA
jgi:hypothetical protein